MEIPPAGQCCWESAIMMLPSPAEPCPTLVMRMCVVILDWRQSGNKLEIDMAFTETAFLFYCHCVDLVLVGMEGCRGWSGRPPGQNLTSIKTPSQLCMTIYVGI